VTTCMVIHGCLARTTSGSAAMMVMGKGWLRQGRYIVRMGRGGAEARAGERWLGLAEEGW
jgi:hypothetical protein